ncbi:MAG: cadherin repeat domain-containing protein [Bacteroidales bacterium]|nr:cadherin repeat domain-containing protein [Bacteroidales bacterium]
MNSSSNPLYSLIVKVTDNGTGSLFDDAVITINVLPATNLPPVISNQTFSINENSPNGTTVGIVVASDPNAGQLFSYVILSGNTGGVFAINSATGKIIVTNSSLLNYESIPSYSLSVKVTDNATVPLSATATITVNLINLNDKPVIGNQSFSVAEFAPNGSLVAT